MEAQAETLRCLRQLEIEELVLQQCKQELQLSREIKQAEAEELQEFGPASVKFKSSSVLETTDQRQGQSKGNASKVNAMHEFPNNSIIYFT